MRFLSLILSTAMTMLIAGPAIAQWDVSKSYDYSKTNTVTGETTINVNKDVDINVDGDLEATGGIDVQGDVVFTEIGVHVQDEGVVSKLFVLDDSVSSTWTVEGSGVVNAAEQLQSGFDNFAIISQNPLNSDADQMNVAFQYQLGDFNFASIVQFPVEDGNTNNFARQIQIGGTEDAPNFATINQNGVPGG